MANHTLKLTNGAKRLAHQMLNVPDLKTPAEKFRAGLLQELLDHKVPHEKALKKVDGAKPLTDEVERLLEEQEAWFLEEASVEVTDSQRDLLRTICTNHADKLPTGKPANRLLLELGLIENP